jgi:hypothetical protein
VAVGQAAHPALARPCASTAVLIQRRARSYAERGRYNSKAIGPAPHV